MHVVQIGALLTQQFFCNNVFMEYKQNPNTDKLKILNKTRGYASTIL